MNDLIEYVLQYGPFCRDCADTDIGPICSSSNLPCGNRRKSIEWVLSAFEYGVKYGYVKSPFESKELTEANARLAALEAENEKLKEDNRLCKDYIGELQQELTDKCGADFEEWIWG